MKEQLLELGLSEQQAQVYLYLLKMSDPVKPLKLAHELSMSRTNIYKILDSLLELDLVRRDTTKATLRYAAEDPASIASFAGRARNEAVRVEKLTKNIIPKLKTTYEKKRAKVAMYSRPGKRAVYEAHMRHATNQSTVYFINAYPHDILLLGHDNMDALRKEFAKKRLSRYGITKDVSAAPANKLLDQATHLTRTWMDQSSYTAPVEWTVSGDELLIIDYSNEGQVVSIKSAEVAESFRQLWKLLDTSLRKDPEYKSLPKRAKRTV